MSTGYQMTLPEADWLVVDRLLYHGRLGGDFLELGDAPMFFYASGELSSVFTQHIFMNGGDWEEGTPDEFDEAYLSHCLGATAASGALALVAWTEISW